jgi:hypothetical protein
VNTSLVDLMAKMVIQSANDLDDVTFHAEGFVDKHPQVGYTFTGLNMAWLK